MAVSPRPPEAPSAEGAAEAPPADRPIPRRSATPTAATSARAGEAADLSRVFAQYGLEDFPYHVWAQGDSGRSYRMPVTHHTQAKTNQRSTMAQNREGKGPAGITPIPWEMPEDLKSGRLPILRGLPDTRDLVEALRRGRSTVGASSDDDLLPDLRELIEEVTDPNPRGARRRREEAEARPDPVAEAKAAPAPEPAPAEAPKADAKSRLRQLALRGVSGEAK